MDVTQIGNTQQNLLQTGQQTSTSKNTLGENDFLKLLVAQMRNQDPSNPMNSKEFASQLAQFNSVEQLIRVNKTLSSLKDSQDLMRTEMTNSMATSLAGKKIRALSNEINLKAGGNADINFNLAKPANKVQIIIKDASSGSEVRTETIDGASSGNNSWIWDGKANNGMSVSEGKYKVEIKATNGDTDVKSNMFIDGIANKVHFTGNGVYVDVNGVEVPIGNIETVGTSNS
ncbi:MAG TPA: flagellar hook capping FlgD N-terminal domain-containing protein [Bacteroidales bacterium]|nr:flagellar hook capping FlgD N-terminal domain-containing protein [Bacteroidales bacterium]